MRVWTIHVRHKLTDEGPLIKGSVVGTNKVKPASKQAVVVNLDMRKAGTRTIYKNVKYLNPYSRSAMQHSIICLCLSFLVSPDIYALCWHKTRLSFHHRKSWYFSGPGDKTGNRINYSHSALSGDSGRGRSQSADFLSASHWTFHFLLPRSHRQRGPMTFPRWKGLLLFHSSFKSIAKAFGRSGNMTKIYIMLLIQKKFILSFIANIEKFKSLWQWQWLSAILYNPLSYNNKFSSSMLSKHQKYVSFYVSPEKDTTSK